jgi:pyruvate/2-oxoglutarate dehydrogenase complex dihydrolipoamide acyltransferase (E2) component
MAYEIRMPKLGLTMEAGTVQSWLISDGATVNEGDVILIIETDKTESELEAGASGVLEQIIGPGLEVPVETILGYIH